MHLDVSVLHDFTPMRDLSAEESSELLRTAAGGLRRHLPDGVAHAWLHQRFIHGIVQARDHVVGCSGLYENSEPILDDEIGETRLADCWHVFQDRESRWPRNRNSAQLTGGDQ